MALKIESVDESIKHDGIKALVYGMLGAGKTKLCATPTLNGDPVLIINAEGGLLSLQDIPKEQKSLISVAKARSFSDIEEIYTHLMKENRYSWVCIDSISEIAEVVLKSEKATEKDGRAAYGNLADIMMDMLRTFRDMPKYNVMMTAKMTRFTDEISNRTMYWPLMPGKQLTNGIGYLFDEVFALRVEGNEEDGYERYLQTSRDIQYEAKDRSGRLDMFEPANIAHIEQKITSEIPVEDAASSDIVENTNKKENENGKTA
jgi:hypothetical protein